MYADKAQDEIIQKSYKQFNKIWSFISLRPALLLLFSFIKLTYFDPKSHGKVIRQGDKTLLNR